MRPDLLSRRGPAGLSTTAWALRPAAAATAFGKLAPDLLMAGSQLTLGITAGLARDSAPSNPGSGCRGDAMLPFEPTRPAHGPALPALRRGVTAPPSTALTKGGMWTPPVGQAWIQNRVGGSGPGTVVCPASRCSAVRLRARMVFVDRIQIGLAGSEAHQHTLVFPIPSCRPFALTRSCVLLPTHPRQLLCFSLLSSLRPVRRRCEPGRSPSSLSAPKPSAPSCWREPPPPASSACVPTSRPATDPCSGRTGPRAQQRPWLP